MRSWYMCILFCNVLTVCRLLVLQGGVQIGFYPFLGDLALLRSIAPLTMFRVPSIPWLLLLLLLSSEPYVGVTLNVEGEGDENVADDGCDNANE